MAKDKKAAKELTMEEKLAQALVPVEEQPYKIPATWCWTTVDKVSRVITGSTPSKKNLEYYGDVYKRQLEYNIVSIAAQISSARERAKML